MKIYEIKSTLNTTVVRAKNVCITKGIFYFYRTYIHKSVVSLSTVNEHTSERAPSPDENACKLTLHRTLY